MTPETVLAIALALPVGGAVLVTASHRVPNLREAITLTTAAALFVSVVWLLPIVLSGARPSLRLIEIFPGLALEFRIEPFAFLFALIASGLWVLSSLYSIG